MVGVGDMSIILSFGQWGGIYVDRRRLCLGWVAITWLPEDIDDVLEDAGKYRRVAKRTGWETV